MMLSRRGWAPRLVAVCLAATSRATATLVAYYSFDDGTAADDGDGSLDGIVSGATASTGPDGSGALSFDGSNDYVKFPDALTSGILGSNARTVCLWAAISSFNDAALFTFGDYADGEEFALMTATSAGGFIVQLYGGDYDTDVSVSGWSDDDGWHFYCLVYDGAEWSFYVDGAVAHTATASLATGSENILTIGVRDGESYLTGSVDELYVYSSALSESEIQTLYVGDTLIAYYSFDDGTAAEDSDSSLDGTISGATATTGRDGSGALSFDGVDDYVEFPDAVTADIAGDSARTVCLWAAIDAFNGGGLFMYGGSDYNAEYGEFGLAADVSFTERIITDSVDDALPVYALDVDGDGDADVLSGSSSDNTFSWYENDAAQSFTERAIAVLADSAKSVFAIDFDDDGDVDALAACEGGSSIAWYENDGSQSFTERVISDEADGVASVQAIDIDGDGDVDGVSALADGNAVVWCENDGAQSFTGHEVAYGGDRRLTDSFSSDASDSISLVAADSLVSGAQCAFAIDVDGDGDVDVLSAAYDDDAIAWHENDGSQGFTEHVISDEADGAHSVYAIDADGDGDIDVLAAYYDSNEVAWHENDGRSFAEHAITDSAASAAAVFAIDADGDGDVDVLSASAGDATIAWYENDCDSAPPTAAPTAKRRRR
ncbi:glutathione transferase [Aureococcus anophagefferens]|nr:glutathione transferase [Aureococcus anophagefferens]